MPQNLEPAKNNTESLLLFLISQQPMYGYQIIRELENKSEGYFRFKEGTLYPALHRLENMELIEGEWQQLPAACRRRRYYSITEKGNSLLALKQTEWQDFLKAMNLIIQPADS